MDMEAMAAAQGGRPHAGLAAWIVEADWAHPWWHSYWVALVHLRPCEGVQAPVVQLVGATHEVMVYALDPMRTPSLGDVPALLLPANFVGQWVEASDAEAVAKVEGHVAEILRGELSPDTDHRRAWVERFSGSNLKPGALLPDMLISDGEGGVAVVGSGKAIAEAILAAGPVPPKREQH